MREEYRVVITSHDRDISDAEAAENLQSVILDGLGFPDGVGVVVERISRSNDADL